MGFRSLTSLMLGILLTAGIARAAPANRFPSFSGYVVDNAGIIDPRIAGQLTEIAAKLDHAGYAQLAVCTMKSLGDESKEEFAADLFRQWQLGHGKEKADGILILMVPGAPGHRQIKVEIGYGMEGLLNDGKVGELLDRFAVPLLKQDQYGPAALSLSIAISNLITTDAQSGGESAPGENGMHGGIGGGTDQRGNDVGTGPLALAICTMGALLILLLSTTSRQQFPGPRTLFFAIVLGIAAVAGLVAMGGGIGSWFAFSAGIGANALAYAAIRKHKCPKCGGWVVSTREVLRKPNRYHDGLAQFTDKCSKCDYRNVYTSAIPRITDSVSSGGGGWSSGGGGGGGFDSGGGGGFSGGGGGDSGGGGAGRDV